MKPRVERRKLSTWAGAPAPGKITMSEAVETSMGSAWLAATSASVSSVPMLCGSLVKVLNSAPKAGSTSYREGWWAEGVHGGIAQRIS